MPKVSKIVIEVVENGFVLTTVELDGLGCGTRWVAKSVPDLQEVVGEIIYEEKANA